MVAAILDFQSSEISANQREHISHGIHVEFTIRANNLIFAMHHLMNIHDNFGANEPHDFGGEQD